MIPAFGPSGVLPPFVGASPADRAQTSPYLTSMTEFVSRFATSSERIAIIRGLLDYRAALTRIAIVRGFQWIDGSFVEDCETVRGRPPADVDIVTFAHRPPTAQASVEWKQLLMGNLPLFDPVQTKATFKCDAYYVDLQKPAGLLVQDTAYFNGLFSHQRNTAQWKGMIAVDLQSDDGAARHLI